MGKPILEPSPAYPAYEEDLAAWAAANAALLRAGQLSEIDREHIAEELEDLGKSERRALGSHVRNLLLHLLKWQHQPARRGPSWRYSIDNARREIQVILADSPSLRQRLAPLMGAEYPTARRHAATRTRRPSRTFPIHCPFGIQDLLDEDFPPRPADP